MASLNHELRTPLTTVLSALHALERSSLSLPDRRMVEAAERACRQLQARIDSISSYFTVLDENQTLNVRPLDLEREVRAAADLSVQAALERGLRLKVEIEDDLSELRMMDEMWFRRAMFNAIDSVIRLARTGTVQVAMKPGRSSDELVVFLGGEEVDFDPTALAAAEQILKRNEFDDSDSFKSIAAVGLSLARRSARAVGGELMIHRMQDNRVLFQLTFSAPRSQEPAPTRRNSEEAQSLKILLVDDNAINLQMIEDQLVYLGHEVTAAPSGRDAMHALDRERFDLVLLDLYMPEIDGFDVIAHIRNDCELNRQTTVVALTADFDSSTEAKALQSGMDGFLSKPFEIRKLSDTLKSVKVELAET